MSALLVLRALLFAGECFLASVALPLLGFALTALLRRAALRHLVWTTLFGVLAVLPIAALLLPPRRIVEHVAAPVAYQVPAMPAAAAPVAVPPPALFTPGNAVLLLLAVWLLGLGFQGLRVLLGQIGLMRLRRAATPFAAGIDTGCAVLLSRGEDGPSTFGILRPVILLPHSASAWPAARLEAVLRHEAAHVARRDVSTQALARLVCAVFWLNPLLWLAIRALRRDAEIAADDMVLAAGMTPSLYAAELVRLAAGRSGAVPGIAMARPPLTRRVEAVLAENSSRKGVTRMDMVKMGLLGLTATLLLGAARFDLAVAQDVAPKVNIDAAPQVHIDKGADVDVEARAAAARASAAADKAKAKADAARSYAQERRGAAEAQARLAADKAKAAENAARSYAEEQKGAAQARAEADAAKAAAAQMRQQALRIRPEIEKPMADAHIEAQVAKALADAHIQETIEKAMADAHVDAVTAKAVADAHIEEKIAAAMARVRPVIAAAVAHAQASVDAANGLEPPPAPGNRDGLEAPPVPPAPVPPPPPHMPY